VLDDEAQPICHAFAEDPRTGANVWFNQAHLFHPSSLDLRTREALLAHPAVAKHIAWVKKQK
jgi:hypothetical protein